MAKELTQTEVKNLFDYVDGELLWKNPKTNRTKKGTAAGTFKDGYRRVNLNYTFHYVHRLVWLYHYGVMPSGCIDHIDMDKSNNRIENLREATKSENGMNRLKPKSNSSGFKGVDFHKGTKSGEQGAGLTEKRNTLVFMRQLRKPMKFIAERLLSIMENTVEFERRKKVSDGTYINS